MNEFMRRRAFFVVSAAPARCPLPAYNHRHRTQNVKAVVATLVAQAHLFRMSPREGEMVSYERLVHSTRRVGA